MAKVFIAVPNLGTLQTDLVVALMETVTRSGHRTLVYLPQHKQPHHRARNLCHKVFLDGDWDYLWFIDADTVPPPGTLNRLLAHDVDIVAGIVLSWIDGGPVPIAFRYSTDHGGYRPLYGEGLQRADVVTMACTLIKRKVLETLPVGSFRWGDDPGGYDGSGEEWTFCQAAAGAGFGIYADFSILCSHYKTIDLKTVNALMVSSQRG